MAKAFGIVHTSEGKPPSWGKADNHAKGCWISMDCNMASNKQPRAIGESHERSAPGIDGFLGKSVPTQAAPDSGDMLEHGMISPEEAAHKPVEAEMDYRSYNAIDWEKIVSNTMYSTVQVRIVGQTWDWTTPQMQPPSQEWSGTAWFIAHSEIGDGSVVENPDELLLITNAHVAGDALYATIMVPSAGAHSIEVEVVGACVQRDLAMLRIKDPAQLRDHVSWVPAPLTLGDSDSMQRAGQVMVLGYPLGLAGVKASMGFVSGYQQFEEQLYLQVTAPIDGGNSGGPLLDGQGHVVGVVSAKIAQASGMSFAIPAIELKALLEVLYTRRTVTLPMTGIKPGLPSSRHIRDYFGINEGVGGCNQSGLLINSVPPASLLEAASIRPGDVLLTVDGASVDRFSEVWIEAIEDRVHFDTFLARKPFLEPLNIEVWREKQLIALQVKYDSTPQLAVPQVPETVVSPPQSMSFGGIAMMNLTYNLVEAMINSRLAKYMDPVERQTSAVVIVGVDAESPAGIDGSVHPGFMVERVNGYQVENIAQVCKQMEVAQDEEWITMHTDRGMVIFTKEEIVEWECSNQYSQPNQLCQWPCPKPEEPEEATEQEAAVAEIPDSNDDSGSTSATNQPANKPSTKLLNAKSNKHDAKGAYRYAGTNKRGTAIQNLAGMIKSHQLQKTSATPENEYRTQVVQAAKGLHFSQADIETAKKLGVDTANIPELANIHIK
jgi:S1-C subfamily serine protease